MKTKPELLKHLPDDYFIDFDKLKVGDKVFHTKYGFIKITNINPNLEYPISTAYTNFTKDGKYHKNDLLPSLFAKNPFFEPIKQERVIEVWDGDKWMPRVLIKVVNGTAVCWWRAETIEESEYQTDALLWNKWREITPKVKITQEEALRAYSQVHNINFEDLIIAEQ